MTTTGDDSGQIAYPGPVLYEPTAVRYPLGPGWRAMAQLAWRPEAAMLQAVDSVRATSGVLASSSRGEPLLLSAGQLERARAFYLRNAAHYPADLVAVIQDRVGAAATGSMDTHTVVAVARYQRQKGLSGDGQAGERTIKAMFGADVRMRADAHHGPEVGHEGTGGIASASVRLTAKIKRAWQRLRPHLPEGAVLVAGLHTWTDSAYLLEDHFTAKARELVARDMLTHTQVTDILAARDYRQMYNWAWSTKGGITQYKVAMPGRSRHCVGDAFDVSGTHPRAIVTAVADARMAAPSFNALFQSYSWDPSSDCVHINLR